MSGLVGVDNEVWKGVRKEGGWMEWRGHKGRRQGESVSFSTPLGPVGSGSVPVEILDRRTVFGERPLVRECPTRFCRVVGKSQSGRWEVVVGYGPGTRVEWTERGLPVHE